MITIKNNNKILSQKNIIKGFDEKEFNIIDIKYLENNINNYDIRLNIFNKNKELLLSYNPKDYIKINKNYIELNIEKTLFNLGFDKGEFYLNYIFYETIEENNFFIKEISPDRTELKILDKNQIFKNKKNYGLYYIDEYLDNQNLIVNNYYDNEEFLYFKLKNPLNNKYSLKDNINIINIISPVIEYDIIMDSSIVLEENKNKKLLFPNFDIKLEENKQQVNTKFFNYDELKEEYNVNIFSKNKFNIDYNNISNFIKFSSILLRLEIFLSKLSQIQNLEQNLDNNKKKEIQNIINSFDHYENYLYFKNEKNSFPKINNNKPFINIDINSQQALDWIQNKKDEFIYYDNNNRERLVYLLPYYILNNDKNSNLFKYLDMIGHFFDNIWVQLNNLNKFHNIEYNKNKGLSYELLNNYLKNLGIILPLEDTKNLLYLNEGENNGPSIINENTDGDSPEIKNIPYFDYKFELIRRVYNNIVKIFQQKGTYNSIKETRNIFGFDYNFNGNKDKENPTLKNKHNILNPYSKILYKNKEKEPDIDISGYDIINNNYNYIDGEYNKNFNINELLRKIKIIPPSLFYLQEKSTFDNKLNINGLVLTSHKNDRKNKINHNIEFSNLTLNSYFKPYKKIKSSLNNINIKSWFNIYNVPYNLDVKNFKNLGEYKLINNLIRYNKDENLINNYVNNILLFNNVKEDKELDLYNLKLEYIIDKKGDFIVLDNKNSNLLYLQDLLKNKINIIKYFENDETQDNIKPNIYKTGYIFNKLFKYTKNNIFVNKNKYIENEYFSLLLGYNNPNYYINNIDININSFYSLNSNKIITNFLDNHDSFFIYDNEDKINFSINKRGVYDIEGDININFDTQIYPNYYNILSLYIDKIDVNNISNNIYNNSIKFKPNYIKDIKISNNLNDYLFYRENELLSSPQEYNTNLIINTVPNINDNSISQINIEFYLNKNIEDEKLVFFIKNKINIIHTNDSSYNYSIFSMKYDYSGTYSFEDQIEDFLHTIIDKGINFSSDKYVSIDVNFDNINNKVNIKIGDKDTNNDGLNVNEFVFKIYKTVNFINYDKEIILNHDIIINNNVVFNKGEKVFLYNKFTNKNLNTNTLEEIKLISKEQSISLTHNENFKNNYSYLNPLTNNTDRSFGLYGKYGLESNINENLQNFYIKYITSYCFSKNNNPYNIYQISNENFNDKENKINFNIKINDLILDENEKLKIYLRLEGNNIYNIYFNENEDNYIKIIKNNNKKNIKNIFIYPPNNIENTNYLYINPEIYNIIDNYYIYRTNKIFNLDKNILLFYKNKNKKFFIYFEKIEEEVIDNFLYKKIKLLYSIDKITYFNIIKNLSINDIVFYEIEPNERNIILKNYIPKENKGFIIPGNLSLEFKNNINSILKEVKAKLI